MSDAEDDDLLVIPDGLINKNPKRWSPADVLNFLDANKDTFFLNDQHIDAIYRNEVAGLALHRLTRKDLREPPYSLADGPAIAIEELIKSLIGRKLRSVGTAGEDGVQGKARAIPTVGPTPAVPVLGSQEYQSPYPALRTYKSKSCSMSNQCNQTCNNIYQLLENELMGTIWKDVCFDGLFKCPATDMHAVMTPDTFSDWLDLVKSKDSSEFETYGAMWFRTFSEQIKAKGLVDAHDSAAERFYYSTGGTILRDAYHGAVRKCDIILTRKLDSKSHGYAIGNAVDLPLPPDPTIRDAASNGATSNKCARSWKDVLVVGELKANFNEDVSKGIILQLGSYARETFCAQPGRRFVNAFTVCGHLARFYFFDRVGVLISTCYDISSKQGQELFMHGLLTYMKMTATELGFDDRYKDIEGNTFLPNNNEPVYLHLEGKTFKLMTTLHRTPAIVSRGTLCWLAREGKCLEEGSTCTNGCKLCLCVIKEAWRDTKLTAESELWKLAKEKNVYGCLDVLVACDADVVSREVIGHNPNNIRNMFDYTGAKPILQGISPDVVDSTGTRLRKNSTALETIHSESKITNQPLSERTKMTKKNPKKRLSSEHTGVNEFPLSKKSKKCGADVVEARTRSFLVVQNVGEKLHRSLQPVELVEALRDAIKCHISLYEDAGILHCDISVQNIMRTRTPIARASGPKGFLIDLDYAQQQYPNSEQSFCMTGTAPFIALELLLKPQVHHTWRHDLESFLYVLIWLCTDNPYEKLNAWVKGLEHRDFVKAKFLDVTTTEFFEDVLNGFHVRFEPLKGLSLAFKEILFKDSKLTTPAGDESRKDIYNRVIQIFDDCVVKLESTQTLEKKEPKELSGHHDKGVEAGNQDWEYVERGTGNEI